MLIRFEYIFDVTTNYILNLFSYLFNIYVLIIGEDFGKGIKIYMLYYLA